MEKGEILVQNITVEYQSRQDNGGFWRRRKNNPGGHCKTVLDNIDLHILSGEFVCLLGHSGCGKSTLLKIIAGFYRPSQGRVIIDDEEVKGPRPNHVFVFQEGALFPWLTIAGNVSLALRSIKDLKERHRRARDYLALADLEGVEHYYPHMLSGGMRQRAEIARALAAEPDVLIMDEPFSGLDYLTRLHLREEMINLHSIFLQTTILFVTHDIDEAIQLGDLVVILSEAPAKIKLYKSIHEPHPRDLTCEALSDLRSQVYHHLGVHAAL